MEEKKIDNLTLKLFSFTLVYIFDTKNASESGEDSIRSAIISTAGFCTGLEQSRNMS